MHIKSFSVNDSLNALAKCWCKSVLASFDLQTCTQLRTCTSCFASDEDLHWLMHVQTWARSKLMEVCVKAHANGRNKSQHCCVLLANNVASVCMGRPKSLTGFKLYATSASWQVQTLIIVVPTSMQTDPTCRAQQCCMLLANNVSLKLGLTCINLHQCFASVLEKQ